MSTRNHASSRSRARHVSTKWRVSAEWAETCKHERSRTWPADAGADRRRHHDGFCHGLHADGPRHVLRLHRLLRRSEEHTSELQSRQYLVCRLLLEKNKPPVSPTQTCQHFSAS